MAKDYSKYTNEELIKYIGELQKQLASTKYGLYWDKNIEEEDAFQLMKTNIPFFAKVDFNTINTLHNNDEWFCSRFKCLQSKSVTVHSPSQTSCFC